jgi:fatty acid desaturase
MHEPVEKVKRRLLDHDQLQGLSRPATMAWLFAVAVEWSIIAACLWAAARWPVAGVWIPAALIIGARQHALGVLAHEGAHFCVLQSGRANDWLANWLTSYPLTFSIEGYRYTHLKHHWYLETERDPSKVTVDVHPHDWTFPMTVRSFVLMILRDLSGLSQRSSASLLKYLWDVPGGPWPHLVRVLLMHGAAIGAGIASGHLWMYPLLWLVPLFTAAVMFYRIRSIAEHSGFGGQDHRYRHSVVDALTATRTTVDGPITRFVFSPWNVSYHIEHHLYPSVPVFRLRTLHAALAQNPEYQELAHVTRGHVALVRELVSSPPPGAAP